MGKLFRLRNKITVRMMIWFVLCNLLLVSVMGWLFFRSSARVLEQEVENYTAKTLEQATRTLDTNLTGIRSSLMVLASNQTLTECMGARLDVTEQFALERNLWELTQNITLFQPIIQDMLMLGNNGYYNNLSGRKDLSWEYDFFSADWYRQAVDTGGSQSMKMLPLYTQDYYNAFVHKNRARQQTAAMSVVVRDSNRQRVIGAVICTFDLAEMGAQLMSSNYEKSGRIALMETDGTIITQNDNSGTGEHLQLAPERLTEIAKGTSGRFYADINGRHHIILYETSSVSGWKLVSYIPLAEIHAHTDIIKASIFQALLLSLVMNLLVAFVVSLLFHRPLNRLLGALDDIQEQVLAMPPEDYTYEELNQISARFSALLERLQDFIQRDYQSRILLQKSQFSALQNQINPHFLFNTLQLLQTEILCENTQESYRIILALSRILRYTIYDTASHVTVRQETDYIRDYLDLFVRKFDGRMSVEYHLPEVAMACEIPKLILQPVVENSIRHGFGDAPREGLLCISAGYTDDLLHIIVRDNGAGIPPARLEELRRSLTMDAVHSDSIGLRNVHQRLRTLYAGDSGLMLESTTGAGTTATLTIDFRREKGECP